MTKFTGQTDQVLKIKLTSKLQNARWGAQQVATGGKVAIEVATTFVGDGSDIKIAVKNAEGGAIDSLKGKVYSNFFRTTYIVSKANKTGGMFFEAELPAHSLKATSGKCTVYPPTPVTDLKWLDLEDKVPEAINPKQKYKLKAKIKALPTWKPVSITVYAKEGKSDLKMVTAMGGEVKDGAVEVVWECPEHIEDPMHGKPHTHEPPKLQFEVEYLGTKAVSSGIPFAPTLPMLILEVEDALFTLDSAVFLPSAPMGPSAADGDDPDAVTSQQATAASGLGIIATLLQYLDAHEGKSIVVSGHTDTSGSASYNFELSGKRAEVVLSVIENKRDKFKSTCQGKHKVEDYQQILKHWNQRLMWDCDPGAVNGKLNTPTKNALKKFRENYNAKKKDLNISQSDLPEAALSGDKLKAEYWGAFFDLYNWELAEGLAVDAAGLDKLRAKVKFVDDGKKFLACGESFPIEKPARDNFRSQTNRRVEILIFDEDEKPDLRCPASRATVHTAKECPIYGLLRYKPAYLTPLWVIQFSIFDTDNVPVEVQRPLKYAIKDREERVVKSGTFVSGTQVVFFGDPLETYKLFVEDDEVGYLTKSSGGAAGGGGQTAGAPLADEQEAPEFDEQIQLVDDAGEPVCGCPFYVEKDGQKFMSGFTDDEGKTPRLSTKNAEGEFDVFWGNEALLKEDGIHV